MDDQTYFIRNKFKCFKKHTSIEEKETFLIEMAKQVNCKDEFLFRLAEFNSLTKIKFYQHRLLPRCDFLEMELRSYARTLLFCDAEFKLREDGDMEITNLDRNIGYQVDYAEGKSRHHLFAEEMEKLTFFLSSSNFKKKIKIFIKQKK